MATFTKDDLMDEKSGLRKDTQVVNGLSFVTSHCFNNKGKMKKKVDKHKIEKMLKRTDAGIKYAVRKLQQIDGKEEHIHDLQRD
jgi:hypothetical protein